MNKNKRKIYIIAFLLLFFTLITAFIVKPSKEEVYAKEFLNQFYTISDYEIFTYLTKSTNTTTGADSAVKYREFFTEQGFKQFITQNVHAYYEEFAYNSKCTLAIKSVDLKQERYQPFDGSREFSFKTLIEVTYSDTNEKTTFSQEGIINVVSKMGDNKIEAIEFSEQDTILAELTK